MYYYLHDGVEMCGFKGLPFALRYSRSPNTNFFSKEQYALILMLDGETEVDPEKLTDGQKRMLDALIREKVAVPTEEKTQLQDYQKYKLFPAMYKRDAHWSITGACNYRCRHCFMSAPDCKFTEPTREQCLNTLSQLHACGVREVSLTGGEPLVSPYFYDILDEISRLGMKVSVIYSNGALVNEQLLDELEKRKMHPGFQMSFDGIGWHDWLRGIDGAEKAVDRAFRLLKERGYSTSSSMCLHRHNLSMLNESIRYLDSVGVFHLKANIASPTGLWAHEAEHFLEENETYDYLLNTAIPQYLKDDLSIGVQFSGLIDIAPKEKRTYVAFSKFTGEEDALSHYACGAMKETMYISPERYVLPCMTMAGTSIQSQFPKIDDMPLQEILSDSSYTRACFTTGQEVVDHNEKCGNCAYKLVCGGGCRACPENENCTDIRAVDEGTCRFFLNGWYDKTIALVRELREKWQREMDEENKQE